MESAVRFRWDGFEPGDPDADEILRRLKEAGADVDGTDPEADAQRDFVVVPVIVGAIALIGLAKAIKGFVDDMKAGMVIDSRGDQVKITKDRSLGRGTVLLISKDGTLSLQHPDADKISDLIRSAMSGLG
jgi:hypothetical protein